MRKTFITFVLSILIFSLTTYAEAKNNNQEFDFTSIGFHGLYDLEISEENGQTLATHENYSL